MYACERKGGGEEVWYIEKKENMKKKKKWNDFFSLFESISVIINKDITENPYFPSFPIAEAPKMYFCGWGVCLQFFIFPTA